MLFDVALVLVGVVIGSLIIWRKPDNWLALWIAILVIMVGTNGTSQVVPSLSRFWTGWSLISLFVLGYFGMISQVYLFFLLPDGRFVPDWSRYLGIGFIGFVAGTTVYIIYSLLVGSVSSVVIAVFISLVGIWAVFLGTGIAAQIFRYRRISNQVQRQQAKWLALGLAVVTVGFLFNAFFLNFSLYITGTPLVILNLVRAPFVNFCLMFLAVGLAMSTFRYRLWDIDLIIRRTLIYGSLTVFLAVLYFLSIVVLQTIFSALGAQRSEISIVISTLVIAALIRPLQRRVQHFIDRRFYRAKIDMDKTLAEFASTARTEVDMDRLAESLLDTVEDTMQPSHVSLWLRGDAR